MVSTKDIDPRPDDSLADQEGDSTDTQAENSATPQNQTAKINLVLPQPGAGGKRLKNIKVKITPKIPVEPQSPAPPTPPAPPAPQAPTPSQTTPSAQKTTSQLPTESQHEESQSPESPLTQTLKDRLKEEAKKRLKDRVKEEAKKYLKDRVKKELRKKAVREAAKVGAQLAARAGVALAATVEAWGPILLVILLIIILIVLAIGLFGGLAGIIAKLLGNQPQEANVVNQARLFAANAAQECNIPDDLIGPLNAVAAKSGLPASFIAAIAKTESNFTLNALGPVVSLEDGSGTERAYGMLQIMEITTYPGLRTKYSKEFKKAFPILASSVTNTSQDLITKPPSPEYSLFLGSKYLEEIKNLKWIKGNLTLTAAGYNVGPYDRAIQSGQLQQAPAETQNYAKEVMRLHQEYAKCLEKNRGIAGGVRLDLNGVPLPVQGPSACAQYSMTMVENYYRVKAKLETITPNFCELRFRLSALNDRLSRVNGAPQYADLNTTSNDPRIINLLVNSLNNGHPVIWPNNFYSGGHFMVFVGYNTDSANNITDFVVYDPALGNSITNTIEGVKLTPDEIRTRGYRGANPGHYYVP